ncbi:type III-A CRISPR-associated RAMP protein Csm5 [Patescibacteria group bacterium]|nr:type III-A CRISPR-associated RAMP protein Csm5 [Patescibacteria group bacterium]
MDIRGDIRELIKNVNNCPYIPGAEIKGTIRTAILWWVVRNNYNGLTTTVVDCLKKTLNSARSEIKKATEKNKVRSKWETMADNEIEKVVFGDDPQKDILKTLYIGDTKPFRVNEMEAFETKVMTVRGNKAYWKVFRDRKNSPDSTDGTPAFIEGITVGKKTISNIKIENFFWEKDKQNDLKFDLKKEYLLKIITICKEYTKYIWSTEGNFYKDLKSAGVQELVSFYNDQKITDLKENEFLLPIGWGTGQGAKTIFQLLPLEIQDELRWVFDLGKFDYKDGKRIMVKPYSKTRKIAFENGKPKYPLGWVKVEII